MDKFFPPDLIDEEIRAGGLSLWLIAATICFLCLTGLVMFLIARWSRALGRRG